MSKREELVAAIEAADAELTTLEAQQERLEDQLIDATSVDYQQIKAALVLVRSRMAELRSQWHATLNQLRCEYEAWLRERSDN